ncbi:hypothetical protein FA15DRAFT_755327 [Coprinopsis marcescibilis]|uniref:DUF6534 domain-containing protein n=1 Tax=Coprinopsis marcescibilis TaxID=230819 RepID=A0A5C3KZN6_COPMA|nr:hypothetical protein FA15DRAFT_755327 [Coprinopsis marcescibilis]
MGQYDAMLGTLLVGVIFNTYLYGVVCCQYARYRSRKFNDPWRIKLSVFTLFTVDTVHSTLMVYLLWIYLVENFANPLILSVPQWPCAVVPIGTAITASITHVFLGCRILAMAKQNTIFVVVIVLTLAEFGTALAFGIRMWTLETMSEILDAKAFVVPWLIIQTTLDIFVSSFLCLFLHRRRTGYQHTDGVINRLIRSAIQTGVFSTILAISGLIAFLVRPNTIIYAMFMIPIGRTYTTTLMDTLNIRAELKERLLNSGEDAGHRSWRVPPNTLADDGEDGTYIPQFPKIDLSDSTNIGQGINKPKPRTDAEFAIASVTLPKRVVIP